LNYASALNIQQYRIEYIEKCPKFSDSGLKGNIPENICPFLLHAVVPYYITYMNEGNFSWSDQAGHVDVQCPNPTGGVAVDVVNDKPVFSVVKSLRGECPMGYASGLKINLSEIFKRLCPLVYDVAFSWMQLGKLEPVTLRCPGCSDSRGLKFILKTNEDK